MTTKTATKRAGSTFSLRLDERSLKLLKLAKESAPQYAGRSDAWIIRHAIEITFGELLEANPSK